MNMSPAREAGMTVAALFATIGGIAIGYLLWVFVAVENHLRQSHRSHRGV